MENKKTTIIKKYSHLLRWGAFSSFSIAIFLFSVVSVHAATLSFSPASGNYTVGKSFSVNVYVSSADQALNAVSGAVSFPSNILEITSISKGGSVINLWVQDPSFSAGKANFEGIVLNPGFKGSSGKIVTINFKVKGTGEATVSFSSAAVLANDGKGTNILSGTGSAHYTIAATQTEPTAPVSTSPAEKPGVPLAQKINSSTHPDSNAWVNNNNPSFTWQLPANTTGVSFVNDHSPSTDPGSSSSGIVTSRSYSNLADGTWYMHLRIKNAIGWGSVSHYRYQIDTQQPDSFTIKEVSRKELTDPVAFFIFQATDVTSGIDHYEIQIDGGQAETWRDDGAHIYHTPALSVGDHVLLAKAVDRAGNSTAGSANFVIKALDSPVFTEYPTEVSAGEVLIAKGTTYPNMKVLIWLQRENDEAKQFTVSADDKGNFAFIATNRLSEGVYSLWAQAVSENSARSNVSNKLSIYARPGVVQYAASQMVIFLSVLVPLIGLLLSLLLMLWYFWSKYRHLSKKLTAEVREAEEGLHESFKTLREHVHEQVKMLEHAGSKRELTREEARIIKQLRSDLDEAEKSIHKEMEDIKKAVK